MILKKIIDKLSSQAMQSIIYKGLTGAFMFFSISLLVRYLGEVGYGIWVLIFSSFQWGLYFDFGISNVLKSKIPELISKKQESLINIYISESIKITFLIALVLFSICCIVVFTFDINSALNIFLENSFIKKVFLLNGLFFCINFVLSINKSLYIGALNPKISELSATISQILFFISILVLFVFFEKITIQEKLWTVTILNGICTILINGTYLVLFFKTHTYKLNLLSRINKNISSQILNNGLKFMLIQIFMVVIFFSDPYFIASYCSPKEISVFDILTKLYQLPLLVIISGLASYWPFFSQKYHEGEFNWFKKTFQKFQKTFYLIFLMLIFFTLFSYYLIPFWVGNQIDKLISNDYLILMMLIVLFRVYFTFYANFFNGINRLNSQVLVMGVTALIKIPLTIYILKNGFGLYGIFLQLLFFMLLWALYFKIESSIVIKKMLNE
jgi:O-antigen/teichoic acid export membrane protein